MKVQYLKAIAEFIGITAIVASLIFVGLELQQSRHIAVADVYQQQAALLIEIQNNELATEPYMEARQKVNSGQALTDKDKAYLRTSFNAWLSYYENAHFQYRQGLLSKEHWLSVREDISGRLRQPIWKDHWETEKLTFRESFASEIDDIAREVAEPHQ